MDVIPWEWFPLLILFLVLLMPFLYDSPKSTVRYHGCYIFYVASVSFTAIACIPLFCLNPFKVRNCLYVSSFLKHITKLLGITWELRGAEVLSADRGAVIVANHQSMLDILGMFNIWHVMDKCAAVARKEVFYVWPFGLAAWLAGVVFIDRLNHAKAYEKLNDTGRLMKVDKTKIWMFPEGTRNTGKSLLPFKKGAFKIAITCQAPIIPIVYSPYYFIDHDKKCFGQGKIIITALPEISTKGLTMNDLDSLMEQTRSIMMKCHEAVCKEIYSKLPDNYAPS